MLLKQSNLNCSSSQRTESPLEPKTTTLKTKEAAICKEDLRTVEKLSDPKILVGQKDHHVFLFL